MQSYRYPTVIALTLSSLATLALPSWSQIQGNHFVHSIRGNVVVGRYLISPDRASEGMVLSTNYRIRLGASSQVTLTCSNNTVHRFSRADTYNVSDYCPSGTARRPGASNSPARDPFDTSLPYLISPRNTTLMDVDTPLVLHWNPVAGASFYDVTVTGSGVNWTVRATAPQAAFTEVSNLRPDYRYSVEITADNGASPITGASVGFSVLPQTEQARVSAQVAQIQEQQLEPDVEAIALALAYLNFEHSDRDRHSYSLNQQALMVLQTRIDAGTQNSQVYLLQGDTYWAMDLPLLAREQYEQALLIAKEANQQELAASSYLALAEVAISQTEHADAISSLKAAQSIYTDLSDEEQVEALWRQIEGLEKEL